MRELDKTIDELHAKHMKYTQAYIRCVSKISMYVHNSAELNKDDMVKILKDLEKQLDKLNEGSN